jgi:glycine/D-amino acid oxidase-like deaminating enzyme
LKSGSLALVGLSFTGCAAIQKDRNRLVLPPLSSPPRAIELPIIHASWDRVIRTTVGLRPHRDAGFMLRADKLDSKLLIHNYGHGGSGMSLSWGTGSLAADLAVQQAERRAAVIGCGVVGLTSARQLQRRGFDVTIYAMSVPPDTTSNMSLAGFTPTSGLVQNDRRTSDWDEQFRHAAEIAYRQLQLLAGPNYGVSWIRNYTPSESVPQSAGGENTLLPPQLQPGEVVLGPGEHPFATKYAVETPSIRIEPSIYLDALVRDFLMFGGRIVIRKFETPRDLAQLTEPVIINCTGLGSRALFGDQELIPVKGQLTHLVPQPEIDYQTGGGPGDAAPRGVFSIHMMPRRDGIALGGTQERNVWTLEPNEEARKYIVDRQIRLFTSMHPPPRFT